MRELRGKIDDSPLVFDDGVATFTIAGRGVAYQNLEGRWKLPEGMWEPWDMSGHPAVINDIEVIIRGVEAFASARSPEWPYNHSFAILVNFEDARKLGWKND